MEFVAMLNEMLTTDADPVKIKKRKAENALLEGTTPLEVHFCYNEEKSAHRAVISC